MDVDPSIWRGKRVLVTGHTGFKGSWLVYLLKDLGAEIFGISLPHDKTKQSLYFDAKVYSCMSKEYFFDIRQESLVEKTFNEIRPDYVFHLAAQAFVRQSVRDPLDSISVNVLGTANVLLKSLSVESVQGVAIITTDKVYENLGNQIPFTESDRLGGNDPYSASKASAEIIVNSLRHSINLNNTPVSTARAGNVIGGGDWGEERLVPDIIRSFIARKTLVLRNPNSLRPWQYVLDCLYGYILLAQSHFVQKHDFPSTVNFGPKESYPVIELVRIFEQIFKQNLGVDVVKSEVNESNWLQLNSELAKNSLDWKTFYSNKEAIHLTAKWYLRFLNGENAQSLIIEEIENFKTLNAKMFK